MIVISPVYLHVVKRLFYTIFTSYAFLTKIKSRKKLSVVCIEQYFSMLTEKYCSMHKLYKGFRKYVILENLSELARIKIKKIYKYVFLIFSLILCFIKFFKFTKFLHEKKIFYKFKMYRYTF
nr:hypothetical protein CparaKRNrm2_p125 [Cryptomonas paramecium]